MSGSWLFILLWKKWQNIWIGKFITIRTYRYQTAPKLKSSKSSAELGRTTEGIPGRGDCIGTASVKSEIHICRASVVGCKFLILVDFPGHFPLLFLEMYIGEKINPGIMGVGHSISSFYPSSGILCFTYV